MNIIDKLSEQHPKLCSYFNKVIGKRKTTLIEDIIFCTAISLAGSFYYFEYYQPKMDLMRTIITLLMLLIWIGTAFANGYKLKNGFMIFNLCYWFIPQIFILWNTNLVESGGYSKSMDILDSICRIIVINPFENLRSHLENYVYLSDFYIVVIFVLIIIITYFAGWGTKLLFGKSPSLNGGN